jgi:hypothetical protein
MAGVAKMNKAGQKEDKGNQDDAEEMPPFQPVILRS